MSKKYGCKWCLHAEIWLTTIRIDFAPICWPLQPPTEMVPNWNRGFIILITFYFLFLLENKLLFTIRISNLSIRSILNIQMTSQFLIDMTTSPASMTKKASFNSKNPKFQALNKFNVNLQLFNPLWPRQPRWPQWPQWPQWPLNHNLIRN